MVEGVKLPTKLDLSAAMPLVSDLKGIEGDMHLDATDVNHMGALCLQALIAASRHAKANGHTFKISNVSDKVVDQMALMGLTPENLMEGV